jgi:putative inorganic carbon (hco3(-)) transporter
LLNQFEDHRAIHWTKSAASRIAGIEIWLLAAAIGLGMLSARLLPLGVSVALLLIAIRWYGERKLSVRTPVDAPVILLVATLPVTLFATAFPETTIPQVLRLLAGLALFYSLVNWATSLRRIKQFVAGLVLAGAALAFLAPFSVTWYIGNKLPFIPEAIYDRFIVLVSDSIHPNVMGGILAILIPITLGLLVFHWRGLGSFELAIVSLVLLVTVFVLFLTKSRGAWMGVFAAVLLIVLLLYKQSWKRMVGISLTSMVGLYFVATPPFIDSLLRSDVIGGMDGRVEIFSRSILMIKDFPFTGIGMGTFANIVDIFYPFFLFSPGQIVHAHNLFLQVALDLGILGLIAWLAVFFSVTLVAIRAYQLALTKGDTLFMGIGAGLLGSQFALAVHGLTDAVVWGMVKPAPLVWALWGLIIASHNFQLSQRH